jgi:SAM-dependent methyltransferase
MLRFYTEVLGLEHLHYGLWEPEDERSLPGVRKAQARYANYLMTLIPAGVKTILDVGCGTGVMAAHLTQLGYTVEGLSPDPSHQRLFRARVPSPFHLCGFEEFIPRAQYDCLLMSESAQYIPVPQLFEVAKTALTPHGYLMVGDYFVLPHASGPLANSGHRLQPFLTMADQCGFELHRQEDLTDRVTPTLDVAKAFVETYGLPAVALATEHLKARRPYLFRLICWLLRKHLRQIQDDLQLLNSAEFKRTKSYQFLLFQVRDAAHEDAWSPNACTTRGPTPLS